MSVNEKLGVVLRNLTRTDLFGQVPARFSGDIADIRAISKEDVFDSRLLKPKGIKKLVPSAGSSGTRISYRFANSERNTRVTQWLVGKILAEWTLTVEEMFVFNAYPLGIYLPNDVYGSDVATRIDIIRGLIPLVAKDFKSILLVAQPHFAKSLVDNHIFGSVQGIRIGYILGGEWFSASFAQFLETKTVQSGNTALPTVSFFGTAETGLGIGFMGKKETRMRKPQEVGSDMIFETNEAEYLVECLDGKLAVTVLDPTFYPPLVRYMTGDLGYLRSPTHFGLRGRSRDGVVEGVQELLYQDSVLPELLSGFFRFEGKRAHFQCVAHSNAQEGMTHIRRSLVATFLEKKGYGIAVHNYREYPYWQSLDRKPVYIG